MARVSRARLLKLAKLRPAEWVDLLQAQATLIWARLLVATRPTGQLVASAAPTEPWGAPAPADAPDPRAERLALAVSRAADFGLIRPLCLVRAVALNRLLESRGIRGSRIRVGVRWDGSRFAAHAWVEHRGRVLGDRLEHVETFTELADIRLLPRA